MKYIVGAVIALVVIGAGITVRKDDWTRKVEVIRVVDGDTVDCRVLLGYNVSIKARIRLHGIDAPESRGPTRKEGLASTAHLIKLLKQHEGNIYIVPPHKKRGKFGRYLAIIYGNGVDINQQMVKDGFAVPYK